MIQRIDLEAIRTGATDLDDLRLLVQQILGEPFLFFRVSYADEVRLHLGDLVAPTNPRGVGPKRGSFVVAARASSWVIRSGTRRTLISSGQDDSTPAHPGDLPPGVIEARDLNTTDAIDPGSIVVGTDVRATGLGFSLRITFSDSSTLLILPRRDDPEGQGDLGALSDWEILTPQARILQSGPGARWSYVSSAR